MAYYPFRDEEGNESGSCEVFYHEGNDPDFVLSPVDDPTPAPAGWYWWSCFPGCLPDGDPSGPFDTHWDALEDAGALNLPPPTFDRFDICEAYTCLEADYNEGGWLHERPSNQRRSEACSIQLARMHFKPRPNLSTDTLTENGYAIYRAAVERLKLPR